MSPWIRYVYIKRTEIAFYIIKISLYSFEIVTHINKTFRIPSDYIIQNL